MECPSCKRHDTVRPTYQAYSQGLIMQAASFVTGYAPMPDIQNYVCLGCQKEFRETIAQPLPQPPA
jgi:transposase-like protein